MTENEIRQTLSKIKMINKKFVSYYYAKELCADDDLSEISTNYIKAIKDLIGSVNKVKSERILKAIGFEKVGSFWCIPANGLELIDDGTELIASSTTTVVKGRDELSLDSRNGMLGYYIELTGVKK